MAGRILGMGDMLTLVEQAQQKFDQDEMAKQEDGFARASSRSTISRKCSAKRKSSGRSTRSWA